MERYKPGCRVCRKVFGGYLDLNIRMGDSIMRAYCKDLGKGIDGSWLNRMPQTTLLTGVWHPLIEDQHLRMYTFSAHHKALPASLQAFMLQPL